MGRESRGALPGERQRAPGPGPDSLQSLRFRLFPRGVLDSGLLRASSLRRRGVCASPAEGRAWGTLSRRPLSGRFLPGRPLHAAPDSCGSHDPELARKREVGAMERLGAAESHLRQGARGVPRPAGRRLRRTPQLRPAVCQGRVTRGTEHAAVHHGLSRGKSSSDPAQTRCSWMLPPPAGLAAFCDIL